MPSPVEVRIQALCNEALAAKTPADMDRIVTELRAALDEHILLARTSLEEQLSNFSLLGKVARTPPTE